MKYFLIAVEAVIPFMLYMAFGGLARRTHAVEEDFLRSLNSMVYKLFFPIMIFNNVYQIDLSGSDTASMIIWALLFAAVILTASWLIVPRFVHDNRRRPIVIQALYRGNTLLFALPLMENLFGSGSLQRASLVNTIVVAFYNMTAVIVLEYYRGGKVSAAKLARKVLSNPIILGAICGMLFALSPLAMPRMLIKPISVIGSMTSPLALFALGGTLHLSSIRRDSRILCAVSLIKLMVIPAIMLPVISLAGFKNVDLFNQFLMLAVPIATATFPMSASMGADGELAGELVAATTLISLFTLVFWIWLLQTIGLIIV